MLSGGASSKELLPEDKILLYGPDLPEIKKNVPFTRITWIQIDPIEDQDKAYQRIKKLEFAKFKIIPEGYMMLSSSMDQKEQVRVSKKAMKKDTGLCRPWESTDDPEI